MSTEQEQWAAQIRGIPTFFRAALFPGDDAAIRHRPAEGEWFLSKDPFENMESLLNPCLS